jgi:hypothetical protein
LVKVVKQVKVMKGCFYSLSFLSTNISTEAENEILSCPAESLREEPDKGHFSET